MGYTNKNVVEAWKIGKKRKSTNGKFSTDGVNLWSYAMLIGLTYQGTKLSLNVGCNPNRISQTTCRHSSLAYGVSFRIEPEIRSQYHAWHRYTFPKFLKDHRDD